LAHNNVAESVDDIDLKLMWLEVLKGSLLIG